MQARGRGVQPTGPPAAQRRARAPITLFVLAACTSCACACSGAGGVQHSRRPVTLVIGMPYAQSDAGAALQNLARIISLDSLTSVDVDGHVVPRLAARWSTSPDGLASRIQLRPNVSFADGTACGAPAVKRALDEALASPGSSVFAPGFLDIASIEASGPLELLVRLRQPSTFALEALGTPITRSGEGGVPVGTGAFSVASRAQDEITLRANPRYYLGRPAIDRVRLKAYPTLRAAWVNMMRGDADMVSEVAYDALEFVESEQIEAYSFHRPYVYAVVLNNTRPVFASAGVRRALNLAVDRNEVVSSVLAGHGVAASDPLWPSHWAVADTAPSRTFDARLAAQLLDAALGREADGGPRAAPSAVGQAGHPMPARLRFTCLVPERVSTLERLALLVQKDLWQIGVDMELDPVPIDRFSSRLRSGDFDAAVNELNQGPSLSRPYAFWHSGSRVATLNVSGYSSPEADRALDAIRHARDEATLRAAVQVLQRVFREDPPAIFLAWGDRARAVSRRFDVPVSPGRDVLRSLWFWRPVADAGRDRP